MLARRISRVHKSCRVARRMATGPMDPEYRGRTPINALTFGSPGSGKTTLNSELTKISHDNFGRVPIKTIEDIDRIDPTRQNKKSMERGSKNVTHLEWDTSLIRVAHTDVPTASPYVKNFLTHISNIDAALWVIDANEGLLEDSLIQYRILQHMLPIGGQIIPFISNNPQEEVLELIKMDLEGVINHEELGHLCSSPSEVPPLLERLFSGRPKAPSLEKPLLWYLENVGNIPSKGTFVAGRIEQGQVKDQETVSAFCRGETSAVTLRSCEIFRRPCGYLQAKERGGTYLRIKNESALGLRKGGVLYKESSGGESSFLIGRSWEVELRSDVGRSLKGSVSLVLIHRTTYDGTCKLEESQIEFSPGVGVLTKISLQSPILAQEMDHFLIRYQDNYLYGVFKNVIN